MQARQGSAVDDSQSKLDSLYQAGLYSSLVPLRQADRRQGELAAAEYPQLRQFRCVPLSHLEARLVARYIPVGFARLRGELQPVALPYSYRRFKAGLTASLRGTIACPILLRAFPLALGPLSGADTLAIALDQPDSAIEDVLYPAFDENGLLTPYFAAKVDYLWLFAATRRATLTMSQAAHNAGALLPWPIALSFDDGELKTAPDLFTVDSGFLDSTDYLSLVVRFGNAVVNLLEAAVLSRSHLDVLSDDGLTVVA